jgi:hypothetical protein
LGSRINIIDTSNAEVVHYGLARVAAATANVAATKSSSAVPTDLNMMISSLLEARPGP